MIEWGRQRDIQREVANVPDNWFARFKVKHPDDWRKMAKGDNGTTLYRSKAVLEAVENGEV